MFKNQNLLDAKINKNDEFYTLYKDIEKELKHYTNHFKDKIIYCNCDNPEYSNFFKYFYMNMKKLEIKKLIATFYDNGKHVYKLEVLKQEKNISNNLFDLYADELNNEFNTQKVYKTYLNGNGDFRSEECINILKESDIIVSNPPFSLFSDYIELLIEHNKKFLTIGNKNAIGLKNIFSLFKNNKIWFGYNSVNKFKTPGDSIKSFGNIGWFTNLKIDKTNDELILTKKYYEEDGVTPLLLSKKEYLKFYNFDAINVNKISDIPMDYYGIMGVPISFLDKFNPEQFEIIGTDSNELVEELGIKPLGEWVNLYKIQGGKGHYSPKMHNLVCISNDGRCIQPYKRVLIRRKM